jgi:hypothetical protein
MHSPFGNHPLWLLGMLPISVGALAWIAAGQWLLERFHGSHMNPHESHE